MIKETYSIRLIYKEIVDCVLFSINRVQGGRQRMLRNGEDRSDVSLQERGSVPRRTRLRILGQLSSHRESLQDSCE